LRRVAGARTGLGLGEAGAGEAQMILRPAFFLLLMLAMSSCAGSRPWRGELFAPQRYVWRNTATGQEIVVSPGQVTIAGQAYALRDCSTRRQRCVESDGPINLVINRSCQDRSPRQLGTHDVRTRYTFNGFEFLQDL